MLTDVMAVIEQADSKEADRPAKRFKTAQADPVSPGIAGPEKMPKLPVTDESDVLSDEDILNMRIDSLCPLTISEPSQLFTWPEPLQSPTTVSSVVVFSPL
jgi:hypothetical protein